MSDPLGRAAVKGSVYRAVRLSVAALGAREVVVTGNFTGWTREGVKLTRMGPGAWETTIQLAPGEYQYRLLVDGAWRDNPAARRRVPNPYGSQNCVLVVQ